jgi:quercetin dioxygenase-like cupin family protein
LGKEKRSTLIFSDLKEATLQRPTPGYRRKVFCDERTPTQNLLSGYVVMEPGEKLDLHAHEVEELQIFLSGYGTIGDIDGIKHSVGPGSFLYCPPGIDGAHSFENTGDIPFNFIFVFSSAGGTRPSIIWVEK